jgi:GNAT superfamily N-acetyltransferase
MIRLLEETSINAWPAIQTVLIDGWVLRFANGYTRRANSVNPLYASTQPIDEKVLMCENLYHARGLNCVFKLTPASLPAGLDTYLAEEGYQADAHTSVQLLDLKNLPALIDSDVELNSELTEEWLDAYCAMNTIPAQHFATIRQMLDLLVPDKRLALMRQAGKVIACGLGVRQANFIGLFDIVVAEQARRKGYGQQLIKRLLTWGKTEGAKTAYLQVVATNLPARQMYSKLGFREEYQYWYRIQLLGL